jgi:hypothetical protein
MNKKSNKALGIPDLHLQLNCISKQLEQNNNDYNIAAKEENEKRKKNYGYYSTSHLDHCAQPSQYHQAIKNLLAITVSNGSQEEKDAEILKINQALYDAFYSLQTKTQ